MILAMYYQPDPETAHASIEQITNDVTLGWLVRGMHRWGASVFIILMFMLLPAPAGEEVEGASAGLDSAGCQALAVSLTDLRGIKMPAHARARSE